MTHSVSGQIDAFISLFLKWNKSINLSAARTIAEVREHIDDSLHVVPLLGGLRRVLDVGSGGGFPVVIAAISLPDVDFVSLEPVHKKHAFLRTAARELGLANLEAHAVRLEDHEGADYDAAISRATFDLADWITLGLARVRPGGFVVGFEAVERPELANVTRTEYSLAGKRRALVVARKST
jgi:16S rRNA (guanine527-N7)-methyltransferase